jgi:hypothetical protein
VAITGGQKKYKQQSKPQENQSPAITGHDEYNLGNTLEDVAPAIAHTERAPKQKPDKKAPVKKARAKKTAQKVKRSKDAKQPSQAAAGKKGQIGKPGTQTRAQQKIAAAEKTFAAVLPAPEEAESAEIDDEPSTHIPASKPKDKKVHLIHLTGTNLRRCHQTVN